jgi:hypothetical protein
MGIKQSWGFLKLYGGAKMSVRPSGVYLIKKPNDEKDILVFDAGYPNGTLYVYELKETSESKDIGKELKEMFPDRDFSDMEIMDIMRFWVDKKYGYARYWDFKTV